MVKRIYESSMDKRILRMKIRTGELKEEDLRVHLENLPDMAANAELLPTQKVTPENEQEDQEGDDAS